MQNHKEWSMECAGRTLTISIGKYALHADGAVLCRYGDTEVLATVVIGQEKEFMDYFPLMVDYEEKFYAAGKIKGSRFIKREGRPTDEAILMARMIDRSIRPLFEPATRRDVQVILTVFSVDEENDPDIPALVAASCALNISPITWHGPIAGIRIGYINGEFVLNPSYAAREKSALDCVVSTTREDKLIMAEAEAKEVPDDTVLSAIQLAKKHNRKMIEFLQDIQKEVGKPKVEYTPKEEKNTHEDKAIVEKFLEHRIKEVLFDSPRATKRERKDAIETLQQELDAHLVEKEIGKERREAAVMLVPDYVEKAVSGAILKEEHRVDGRALDEIRPITAEIGIFARTHGSAHFLRGETQVVSVVTLGSPGDVQFIDTMESDEKKHFMHHYNFPPFSVGEVKPLRGPSRRDIGHGALVEKALRAVLPDRANFPYTIRVVSEVLTSNGSSSMASTCGSSLALMDAGIPIKHHVAGIAIGLASEELTGKYTIITDLQDLEDGKGGMDFKICGTSGGITAIQMDTKTRGLPDDVVASAFKQARFALNKILLAMTSVIPHAKGELSPYAPRIYTLQVNPEKIGLIIGPQGKTINKIIDETGVDIDIEKDGTVMITSASKDGATRAIKAVEDLVREVAVGESFEGKVTRVTDFGAFVELTPSQEGLVHVSNLSNDFVKSVSDAVKVGDTLKVKVFEIDYQGRVNLTVEGVEPKPRAEKRFDNGRGGSNGHGGFRGNRGPRFRGRG